MSLLQELSLTFLSRGHPFIAVISVIILCLFEQLLDEGPLPPMTLGHAGTGTVTMWLTIEAQRLTVSDSQRDLTLAEYLNQ